MDAQSFCYWLQGFVELCPNQHPTISQWNAVKDHLQVVFNKVTPQYNFPPAVTPGVGPRLQDTICAAPALPPVFPGLTPVITC